MDESVDPLLDLDERSEVREVADLAVDPASDRVLLENGLPRVRERVFQRERDPAGVRVDVRDDGLDLVSRRHELRGVLDLLRPAHLRDVHEPLDTLLELHERAVVGHVGDAAADAGARRVFARHVDPRVFRELLGAERDALGLAVELQDDDVDLVADLHEV